MPQTSSQAFLRKLDKKLWNVDDRLRSNLNAAVYKHAFLGLISLKYVSDSFAQRQAEIEAMLRDPKNDFFIDPADSKSPAKYDESIAAELPADTEILKERGRPAHSYKITATGNPFEGKMPHLVAELEAQFAELAKLETATRKNLQGLGYAL
jgi:type I restriction-modification system DNA methylase subunit